MSSPTIFADFPSTEESVDRPSTPPLVPISATLPPSALNYRHNTNSDPQYTLRATLMGHTKGVSSVKLSPDARFVITAGGDSQLLLYSLENYAFVRSFEGHSGGINDVAWSPDGNFISSASDDMTVRVWYVKDATLYRCFQGHTSFVFCIAYNPEGTILVSGGFDEALSIWDVKKGNTIKSISGAHDDPISSVAFSHDSATIASCSYDKLIRLWDASSYQCLKTILHTSPLSYLTFTPNNKFLLCCSLDSTICLIACTNGKVAKTYSGHTNTRWSTTPALLIQTSKDENPAKDYLVCGSEDGKIWIWDIQTRSVIASWQAHIDAVIGVDCRNGYLVSGSLEKDQTAKIWFDLNNPGAV